MRNFTAGDSTSRKRQKINKFSTALMEDSIIEYSGIVFSEWVTTIQSIFSQVRETAPPFRVLEKCQDLCLRDRSGNSLVRTCNSIDFQPGARIAAFSPEPEYEESTCYLTREQAAPEGIGTLMIVPNSVHFNEICLTCK